MDFEDLLNGTEFPRLIKFKRRMSGVSLINDLNGLVKLKKDCKVLEARIAVAKIKRRRERKDRRDLLLLQQRITPEQTNHLKIERRERETIAATIS